MTTNRTKRRRAAVNERKKALREAVSFDAIRDRREQLWTTDNRSFDSSFNRTTRLTLIRYARDEVYNDSYAFGAAKALATSVIGTKPQLQVLTDSGQDSTDSVTEKIERDFDRWSDEVGLGRKLRAMRFSKFVDGEAFCVMHFNDQLRNDVKLDITPVDAERVTSNTNLPIKDPDFDVDGITIDNWGNPVSYRVLRNHPGGNSFGVLANNDATDYPANLVCHWYNQTSSEMRRGIPEVTPALKTFGFLRRYIYSVVRASEVAADIAMCLYSDNEDESFDSFSTQVEKELDLKQPIVEHSFSRGTAVSVPFGMKVQQVKPEQPASNFEMLVRELLASAGAAVGLPAMIMLNTARGQTYAGGRIELQEFYRFVNVEQKSCIESILEPILAEWLKEWFLINNISPKRMRNLRTKWQFDGFEHIDPLKEASAQIYKIQANTSTLATEYAKVGKDWLTEIRQRALELKVIKELEEQYGITMGANGGNPSNLSGAGNKGSETTDGDEE